MSEPRLSPATTLEELDAIASLATEIWQHHYVPIIGQEQVTYMLSTIYSRQSLQKQVGEGQQFFLVDLDGNAEGFLSVSERADGLLFLHKFYINTHRQGQGLGRRVFARMLLQFPESQRVQLTVNRQNYKSINFYFGLGFRIVQVADFDIGNGYCMNDFVMECPVG